MILGSWKCKRLAKARHRKHSGIWEQSWGSLELLKQVACLHRWWHYIIPLMNASSSTSYWIKLLTFTPQTHTSHCHLKHFCGQLRPICSCANADFASVAFAHGPWSGHDPICFLRRRKNFLCTFLYGEFGNRRRALSNWESSRGQWLLLEWSKYFHSFTLPLLNFCILHPFLYHMFLLLDSCFVSCGTWHMRSLSLLSPFAPFSLHHHFDAQASWRTVSSPQWFRFPFQLRSVFLAS